MQRAEQIAACGTSSRKWELEQEVNYGKIVVQAACS